MRRDTSKKKLSAIQLTDDGSIVAVAVSIAVAVAVSVSITVSIAVAVSIVATTGGTGATPASWRFRHCAAK